MSHSLRLPALLLAVVLAALVTSFFMAESQQSLGEGFAHVTAAPWGVVALLDLYVGLGVIALWIHVLERDWRRTLAWAVMLVLLGNAATLAYLLLRVRRVRSFAELFTVPRS